MCDFSWQEKTIRLGCHAYILSAGFELRVSTSFPTDKWAPVWHDDGFTPHRDMPSATLSAIPQAAKFLVLNGFRPDTTIALGGTEVTGFHTTQIHDKLLQHHARIHHPELQRVIARFCQQVCGRHFADAVFHGGSPGFHRVLRERANDLRRFVIE